MKSCTEAGKSLHITQWCGARNLQDKLHAFLISTFNFIDFPLPVHVSLVPPPDQPLSSLSLSATSLMREIYLEFNAEQTSLFVCCASHEGAMSRRGQSRKSVR